MGPGKHGPFQVSLHQLCLLQIDSHQAAALEGSPFPVEFLQMEQGEVIPAEGFSLPVQGLDYRFCIIHRLRGKRLPLLTAHLLFSSLLPPERCYPFTAPARPRIRYFLYPWELPNRDRLWESHRKGTGIMAEEPEGVNRKNPVVQDPNRPLLALAVLPWYNTGKPWILSLERRDGTLLHSPCSQGEGQMSDQQQDLSINQAVAVSPQAIREFPFPCHLSLAPLFARWERVVEGKQQAKALLFAQIQAELEKTPALLEPITDLSLIEKHRELIDVLMTLVFPPARWEREYSAALLPFQLRSFYATPCFQRLFLAADGTLAAQANLDKEALSWGRLLRAYLYIGRKFYDIDLQFDYPLIFTTKDPATGLDRHFKISFDPQFLELKLTGPLPRLGEAEKKRLLANVTDLHVWMELIPPEHFTFYGFTVVTAVDVTDQEVLSSLKRDLIERESVLSAARFAQLQTLLRTLLRQPHLVLGLAAIQGDQVFLLNYGCHIEQSCIFADSAHYRFSDFHGSVYEQAVRQGKPLVIEDLATYAHRSSIEEEILRQGIRNMVVAPLYYQDELIGMLELGSPHPGELNAINVLKLQEVLPLFSMAIKRSIEELNTRVQAIIKEQCTAIHPVVEWRFQQAALNFLARQKAGRGGEMEPIVFDEVYPLYGVSDIRGSSTQRNAAIQGDLVEHLKLARAIIRLARTHRPLPFLDELIYRIDKHITQIESGLSSGDELATLDFLRRDVEPLFPHLQEFGADVQAQIDAYRHVLDPERGTLYRRRKDFEESVTLINETIATHLERAEEKAQAMFPHYFEKHKSDGVEYGIYIGGSLVPDGKFDRLYLRNIRLWQLLVMCEIASKTEQLKGQLKVPLETAHLILVQDTPLSIRFRFDEKRFDVDGTYNIRYEIMKKRIDKARIRGRAERLTQPGKIAIVYSQSKEALEYREYIEYLQSLGYITESVEEVDLEDLQGIQGLKALRVTVHTRLPDQALSPEEIREAVQSLP
ncbi:MAG: GAF domain-containing protein [Nitrospinota bacterium]|nr:MAG: GAF domain-containing protein [Nitrospinota bacterium]